MRKQTKATRKRSTTPPALLVPRHIRIINQVAQAAGISVTVSEAMAEEGRELVCLWEGTKSQLRATRLVLLSYHFPMKAGTLSVPDSGPWGTLDRKLRSGFISGKITVQGSRFTLRATGGEIPDSIEERGGVEISSFADRIVAHGSADALIAAGICTAKQIPGPKRHSVRFDTNWHSRSQEGVQWVTQRVPDSSYVHFRETEHVTRARKEEREAWARQHALSKQERSARERRTIDLADADEYRERLEDRIVDFARLALNPRHTSVETKQGYRFTITPKAAAEALNAIEAAAQCLRTAPVRMEKLEDQEAKAEARAQVADADGDAEFQRFLKGLTSGGGNA